MPMCRYGGSGQPPGVEQGARSPRIFGRNHIGQRKRMPGAQGEIRQITNRSRHHVQTMGGPLLRIDFLAMAVPSVWKLLR